MFANENSNESFLSHHHANKKNIEKRPLQAFFGELTK